MLCPETVFGCLVASGGAQGPHGSRPIPLLYADSYTIG